MFGISLNLENDENWNCWNVVSLDEEKLKKTLKENPI
jgi:hypothetical protein